MFYIFKSYIHSEMQVCICVYQERHVSDNLSQILLFIMHFNFCQDLIIWFIC